MVRIIKLMIRKSKSGKKYYRITIPIANEVFEKSKEFGVDYSQGFFIGKPTQSILV